MDKKKVRKYALPNAKAGEKDPLDRIRDHLFTEGAKPLGKRDTEKLERLEEVNQLLTAGNSKGACVKLMQKKYELSAVQVYRLIRESQNLFGDILASKKEGMQNVLYEMYMRGAAKAQEVGDLQTYKGCLDSIARMYGLFDNSATTFNIQNLEMPAIIFVDSDIETLKRELEGPVIEI